MSEEYPCHLDNPAAPLEALLLNPSPMRKGLGFPGLANPKPQTLNSKLNPNPVRQALRVLAGEFVAQHPSYTERVARALLAYLLVLPAAGKCAITALEMAKELDHPLLQGAWTCGF